MKKILIVLTVTLVLLLNGCDNPDFTLYSEDLANEFEKDRDATNSKYAGKDIELIGQIFDITEERGGDNIVYLNGAVFCYENSDEFGSIEYYQYDMVTIRGILAEQEDGASLIEVNECRVTKIETEPKISTTPEELTEMDLDEYNFDVIEIEFVIGRSFNMMHEDYELGIPVQYTERISIDEFEKDDTVKAKAVVVRTDTPWGFFLFVFDMEIVE
mgnify:CR=1 FL=1